MQQEKSYGIIPCRKNQGHWEIFLVQLHAGHWGFPKGHANVGEGPLEAAERELYEETKLRKVRLILDNPFTESYSLLRQGVPTFKTVCYYLAEVQGDAIVQAEEIQDSGWFPVDQILERLTFPEAQKVGREAIESLLGYKGT